MLTRLPAFLLVSAISFISFLLPANSQTTHSVSAQNPPSEAKAAAEPSTAPIPPNSAPISKTTRLEIIRTFETQLVYARTAFPMGSKGLKLKEGVVTPNGEELRQALVIWGPAVKPGDPAHISYVRIRDDHIHFEINGGPVHRKKWYQRVEISGTNGPVANAPNQPLENPHGSFVDVYFAKYVPEMTSEQLRDLLYPVLDFRAPNKEQAYLDTLPPKAKEAIQAHHVLVGMDQEMVLHAKGKPARKVRERDGETEYEEWIYGEPPADVDFVRLVGDEVVRVETMKVGGEKIVRTEKEVIFDRPEKEAKQEPQERPTNAPSLRRPGEDPQDVPRRENGASPTQPVGPPDFPQPGGGPGEMIAVR